MGNGLEWPGSLAVWAMPHVHTHTHMHMYVHTHAHAPPRGESLIWLSLHSRPQTVQESIPAPASPPAGSFLLQRSEAGGMAKDQYLFWCKQKGEQNCVHFGL